MRILDDSDDESDRFVAFRDRLRTSTEDRTAYKRLKHELARRHWEEIGQYADANDPRVETILARGHQ